MGLFQNVKQTLSGIVYTLLADSNGNLVGQNGTGNALNVYQTNSSMAPAVTGSSLTTLSITASSQSVLTANPNRRGYSVFSTCPDLVYLASASSAATGSFSLITQPNGYEEVGVGQVGYTGPISAVGAPGAVGSLIYITEYHV